MYYCLNWFTLTYLILKYKSLSKEQCSSKVTDSSRESAKIVEPLHTVFIIV